VEVSGSKIVANCGRSTYKFPMCFDCCLPFQGDLKNPGITRTIHLRRQFRPACFRVDKRWHTAYRSTLSRGTVGIDLLPGGVCCRPWDVRQWVRPADRQKTIFQNTLFGIPDLDLSDDLCAERLAGPCLGACRTGSGRDKQSVEGSKSYKRTERAHLAAEVRVGTSSLA
jgi:hypothetical protein